METNYLKDLSQIKMMMERSSRFISLSGLSGVLAGLFALAGAAVAYLILDGQSVYHPGTNSSVVLWLILDGVIVLILAVGAGMILTIRRTRRMNIKVWDGTSRRLAVNLFIPLATGGILIIIIMLKGFIILAAPLTLIFYGLGLINASKYTLSDIRYLGLSEIVIGLTAAALPGYGLAFWALGFGVLHIVYGMVMYYKYEA